MNIHKLTRAAMIAALYTVLCLMPFLSVFAFGQVQCRIAEVLTMLPLISRTGIWGLGIGCFISNLLGAVMGINPTGVLDSVIGTAATVLAAICTYKFRNYKIHNIPVLSILMPVVFNFFFVGAELAYLFMPDRMVMGTLINGSYVALGELPMVILGWLLSNVLARTNVAEEEAEEK